MRKILPVIFFFFVFISAFTGKRGANKKYIWPASVYPLNTETEQFRINLGRALFYDPVLSADSSVSCASCHSPYNAFAHTDHALSHGIYDSIGKRNAPALMNLAWQPAFMWDGNVPHIDMQSLFPITHPAEMGENFQHVILKLQRSEVYRKLYHQAWNEPVVTGERTLKSISSFMLSLISNNSKYDSVMRAETFFSPVEARGYKLFRKNCASCHQEPLFSSFAYENNGLQLNNILNDFGRMNVTGHSSDSLKFKVPTLRNIEYSYPYMHDGRFRRLAEVLNHYTGGIVQSLTLSSQLRKEIKLSADEKTELTAFLLTLSDRSFLFNPQYGYPHQLLSQPVTNHTRP